MQPAGAGKPCLKGCIRQRSLCATKYLLCMFQADVLQEFFRTYSRPIRKHPLEMIRTYIDMCSNLFKPRLFLEVRTNVINGSFYATEICVLLRFHNLSFDKTKVGSPAAIAYPEIADLFLQRLFC